MEELQPDEVFRALYGFEIAQVGARWLTRPQLRNLFICMDQERDVLLYGLLAETGAKLNEILQLELEHGQSTLPLPRRDLPVDGLPTNLQRLIGYHQISPLSARQAERRIKRIGEQAGIESMTTHLFRTSYAVHFLASGGQEYELAWILGYRDLRGVHRLLDLEPQRNGYRCLGVVVDNVRRKGGTIR